MFLVKKYFKLPLGIMYVKNYFSKDKKKHVITLLILIKYKNHLR